MHKRKGMFYLRIKTEAEEMEACDEKGSE